MKKKKFYMEVDFSLPVYVTVHAEDEEEAREMAELIATREFRTNLDSGMYGVSDFDCDAYVQ